MLTVFEVLPDDTVRARVFTDWMKLDLRYMDGRWCTVAEMVEVLPEGGEGGHWRLERRVYRDVEVPWYICRTVILDAVYPEDCPRIGAVYGRCVGDRLEGYVWLSFYDSEGVLCPLSTYELPTSLFALSSYLRDGTTVVNVKWGEVERVDAREWEKEYRDPYVMGLASSLRNFIIKHGLSKPALSVPLRAALEPGVRTELRTWPDRGVEVELWHDLMYLDITVGGGCWVDGYGTWVERRDGEYVLSRRGGGREARQVPRHLCDVFMDGLFSMRDVWRGAYATRWWIDWEEGEVEMPVLVARIGLMDYAARGVMEPLRPIYAAYLTALGFPVRTIDGEDVDGWASRHPPRDWYDMLIKETGRLPRV